MRRAYLCGVDSVSGKGFEHRRGWIVGRIKDLAALFAIDVAAYAVMSNHHHLVVRVDAERSAGGSNEEVLQRVSVAPLGKRAAMSSKKAPIDSPFPVGQICVRVRPHSRPQW